MQVRNRVRVSRGAGADGAGAKYAGIEIHSLALIPPFSDNVSFMIHLEQVLTMKNQWHHFTAKKIKPHGPPSGGNNGTGVSSTLPHPVPVTLRVWRVRTCWPCVRSCASRSCAHAATRLLMRVMHIECCVPPCVCAHWSIRRRCM